MSRAFALLLTLSWSAVVFAQEIIWNPETLLTIQSYNNASAGAPQQSSIAVTSDGQVHIVWTSYRPNPQTPQVYYKRYIPGTGWIEDTCISADLAQWHRCGYPAIAADSQDNIHIVWQEYNGYHIWYKMRRSDGTWDTVSTEISVGSGTMPRSRPKVACTPDGNVHVVWREWYPIYGSWIVYREKRGNVWLPPATVDSVDTTYTVVYPSPIFAADRNARLHLVFVLRRPPFLWVYYRCRTGGVWGPREEVAPSVTPRPSADGIVLSVNPLTNEPHICWGENSNPYLLIKHIYKYDSLWYEQTVVPSDSVNWLIEWVLAFDRDGMGHLIWHKVTTESDTVYLFYRQRAPTGEWGPPELVRSDLDIRAYYPYLITGCNSENYKHLYLLRTVAEAVGVNERLGFMHGVPAGQGVVSEGLPGSGKVRPLRLLSPGCGEYFLERGCRVHLALYDPAGRLLRELDRGRKPRGRHTFKIPESLAAGVYFVHLQAEGVEAARKLVRIR